MSINDSTAQPSVYPKTAVAEVYEDRLLTQAANEIFKTYGDIVSVTDKGKTLRKFGRNRDVSTTFETVWNVGGDETYATDNVIDKISSSNAGDDQTMVVEGHTINASGELSFSIQSVDLVGQTETALSTPLARVTRAYNNNTTSLAGDVYIYEDDTVTAGVPQTPAKIHMKVGNNTEQSEKASTSVSNSDYWIITTFEGFCFDKSAATVEFEIQVRKVGTTNKVFRRSYETAGQNGSPSVSHFDPPLIISRNSDVRVRASADNASTDVGASLNGYLAIVK